MAKTTLMIAVLLLFLAVSAQARFSLHRPVDRDQVPLTEPEPSLLLPSQSTAVVAWEPETGLTGALTGSEASKSLTAVGHRLAKSRGAHHKAPFSFRLFGRSKAPRGGRVTGYRHAKRSPVAKNKAEAAFGDRTSQFPGRLMRLRNPGMNRHVSRHVSSHVGGGREEKRTRQRRHEHVRHVRREHEHVRHVHHEKKRGGANNNIIINNNNNNINNNNGIVRKIRKFLMSF